jgi:cyclopropane fatty-acyl-phospholipid synthase-like methyltransferase
MDPEQEQALAADGDGYHQRNYSGIGTIADPAFEQMEQLHQITPIESVLEIGCTTGFRLEKARKAFGARCSGLEISSAAISEGKQLYPEIELVVGTAPRDLERWSGNRFDVIVVGHLQYLLPREDLFALAAAVDSLLKDSGHVITMDFISPTPTRSEYSHSKTLSVFKDNPSAPWTWSPTYFLVSRQIYAQSATLADQVDPRNWQTVDVIRKLDPETAYRDVEPPQSVHGNNAGREVQ